MDKLTRSFLLVSTCLCGQAYSILYIRRSRKRNRKWKFESSEKGKSIRKRKVEYEKLQSTKTGKGSGGEGKKRTTTHPTHPGSMEGVDGGSPGRAEKVTRLLKRAFLREQLRVPTWDPTGGTQTPKETLVRSECRIRKRSTKVCVCVCMCACACVCVCVCVCEKKVKKRLR